jgi:hypothetical protein
MAAGLERDLERVVMGCWFWAGWDVEVGWVVAVAGMVGE